MKTSVIIFLNIFEALNDKFLHERSACDPSANVNKISKKNLIRRILLSIFVNNIKSKGFFDILSCYDIQSTDCVIFDHFDIVLVPYILINLWNLLFKKSDSKLLVSVVCRNFGYKIIYFFEGGFVFSLSVLPNHFDVLFHFIIPLIKIFD